MNPDSGPSQLSVLTDITATNVATRQWNMKIHQYECGSPNLGTKVQTIYERVGPHRFLQQIVFFARSLVSQSNEGDSRKMLHTAVMKTSKYHWNSCIKRVC